MSNKSLNVNQTDWEEHFPDLVILTRSNWLKHRFGQHSNTIFKRLLPNCLTHHIYLDKSYLHGHAMSKLLPIGEFQWIDPTKCDLIMVVTVQKSVI